MCRGSARAERTVVMGFQCGLKKVDNWSTHWMWIQNTKKWDGRMASTDYRGYVELLMVGFLALLTAALAESKSLSL
jgi:hypothetical protein